MLNFYGVKILYGDTNTSPQELKLKVNDFSYTKYAIVKENDSRLWIETGYYEPNKKPTRYIVGLDNQEENAITGQRCFRALQKNCYKAMKAKDYNNPEIDRFYNTTLGKYECSAGPIIGFNHQYEKQELYDLYEYDLNSAYSSIMLDKIPDVNNPIFNAKLKRGQVGFWLDEKCSMTEIPGIYCQVIFNLIELDAKQKKYIENLYNKKATTTDKKEKDELKLFLNAGIGYYQRFNPFIRAYIVHKCNEKIKALIDENTVLWNTDAIFSLKRRPELTIGAKIGEFKEIPIKRFAYIGNNYQVDLELPKYRGIPKAWYKEGWDILKDPLPQRCNMYIFDLKKMKIIKNKEYINETQINSKTKSS